MSGPSRLADLDIAGGVPDMHGWDLNKSLKPLLQELGFVAPPIKSDAIKELRKQLPGWFAEQREKRARENDERRAELRKQEEKEKLLRAAARKKAEEDKALSDDAALRFWVALTRANSTPADVQLRLQGPVSVRAWCRWLAACTSVRSLDLSSHSLRDDVGVELAGALAKNDGLLSLDLSGNLLGPGSLAALSDALRTNTSLRTLTLDDNPLCAGDPSGFEELGDALRTNSSLTSLSLFRTSPMERGGHALAAGVEGSASLLRLQLAPVDGVSVEDAVVMRASLGRNHARLREKLLVERAERAAARRAAAERSAAEAAAEATHRKEAWVEEQRRARELHFAQMEREEYLAEERARQERELAARPWIEQMRAAKAKEAAKGAKKKAKNIAAAAKSLVRRPSGSIGLLDGIRALSVAWVVAHHALTRMEDLGKPFADPGKPFLRPLGFDSIMLAWYMAPVRIGTAAVDLFFLLSGFLIAYLLGREVRKTGCINIPRFLGRRWLRLTPVYALVILLFSTYAWRSCFTWGWTNLLFINNFVGPQMFQGVGEHGPNSEQAGCMGHSWSIAVEFQMYLASPPLVLAMHRLGRLHWLVPAVGTAASAWLRWRAWAADNDHDALELAAYNKPLTRFSPYLAGMEGSAADAEPPAIGASPPALGSSASRLQAPAAASASAAATPAREAAASGANPALPPRAAVPCGALAPLCYWTGVAGWLAGSFASSGPVLGALLDPMVFNAAKQADSTAVGLAFALFRPLFGALTAMALFGLVVARLDDDEDKEAAALGARQAAHHEGVPFDGEPPVPEAELAAAVAAEVAVADLSSLVLKTLRGLVETRLGVPAGTLKGQRDEFKALALQCVAARQADQAGASASSDSDDAKEAPKPAATKLRGRAAPMILMPSLRALLKVDRLPRAEITKRIWAMIRERDLPKRGGAAVLDAELATALGRKTVSFKTMGRTIEGLVKSARHLVGYDADGNWVGDAAAASGSGSDDSDDGSGEEEEEDDDDDSDDDAKAPRAASSRANGRAAKRGRAGAGTAAAAAPAKRAKSKAGGLAGGAVVLNDELARLTGARVTSRSQISKWLWSRIRARGLQNPGDRRKVTYDEELAAALKSKAGTIFTMNRHISNAVRKATPEEAEEAVAELRMEAAPDAAGQSDVENQGDGEDDGEGDGDAAGGSDAGDVGAAAAE
ncbi:hypothetical protein FNF29_00008 [Cafeteria roenbergensis]|uniref:DM2 domain-containing protein n=1 Tax=Cafeteria roenbergensis TaxID=33653 RepID=A0A5A8CW98_CAFRO|nr:hypothetical protein FNF29_00008 [Cafeteria roenbergensis]|eukprot:KAA0157432.1 hypothetical protein FNF29_00008 [Cafeteria roenbergensis]